MYTLRWDNVQGLLGAIGRVEAKREVRTSPAQPEFFCAVYHVLFRPLSNARFLPNLATTREFMYLKFVERDFRKFSCFYCLEVRSSAPIKSKSKRSYRHLILTSLNIPGNALQTERILFKAKRVKSTVVEGPNGCLLVVAFSCDV